jgi:Flp pilus assembly protein TadB
VGPDEPRGREEWDRLAERIIRDLEESRVPLRRRTVVFLWAVRVVLVVWVVMFAMWIPLLASALSMIGVAGFWWSSAQLIRRGRLPENREATDDLRK